MRHSIARLEKYVYGKHIQRTAYVIAVGGKFSERRYHFHNREAAEEWLKYQSVKLVDPDWTPLTISTRKQKALQASNFNRRQN